jgi:branched-chain amino acid aminotransferase
MMDGSAGASFRFEANTDALSAGERAALLRAPGFGKVFTDHMITMHYTPELGWHDGLVGPHGNFAHAPATLVLHYAQEIFEGLKAYRQPDGGAAIFRPDANARRFANSARRLAMPPLPEHLFVESLRALVRTDRDWLPEREGDALYLRPFMFATDVSFALRPSSTYTYCVIASPVGSVFTSGASAVTLWVSETHIRAVRGGTGEAKCGGNYAAGLAAQAEAVAEGCDQVIFLDALERRWVEELGGMNVFFVFEDGTLQTPPLGGTILPGITRDSLLQIGRDLGLSVREAPYDIAQWQQDAQSGRLREAFACGTAAVVTPIAKVKLRTGEFMIGGGEGGPISARLKTTLLNIQNGRVPDPHGWLDRLW